MIKLEDAAWGLRIELKGQPTRQELSKLVDDLRKALPNARPFFGVILDMTGIGLITPEIRDMLLQAEKLLQARGMLRLAACPSSALAASQIRRISADSGILPGLRCIDIANPDWQRLAEHWAVSGREPDGSKTSPSSHPG
jgi:hypothetical protein